MGCLRNFQLDLRPLQTPSASFRVSPCLGGSLEKGIYFPQEGGHVVLGKEQSGGVCVPNSEELHLFPWIMVL